MIARLPVITPRRLISALGKDGWYLHHATGSHKLFRHPVKEGRVVVPFHAKDLKRGTLKAILAQADITESDLQTLLSRRKAA